MMTINVPCCISTVFVADSHAPAVMILCTILLTTLFFYLLARVRKEWFGMLILIFNKLFLMNSIIVAVSQHKTIKAEHIKNIHE